MNTFIFQRGVELQISYVSLILSEYFVASWLHTFTDFRFGKLGGNMCLQCHVALVATQPTLVVAQKSDVGKDGWSIC